MKYKNIIFDLDGTLTDSKEGIVSSLKYSLKKFDIELPENKLVNYIGEPLKKIYAEILSTEDEKKIADAILYYREHFKKEGISKNRLYDGIEELIKKLFSYDADIFLATIKPTEFAKIVLKNFSLLDYFKGVVGTKFDGGNSSKEELIGLVLQNYSLEKEKTVMIGDRESDYLGARYNKIDCFIVGYGYMSQNEKNNLSESIIVKDVSHLETILF